MSYITANQRNATRNQSIVDFTVENMFLFENRFVEATFKNTSGASLITKNGFLVTRDAATGEIKPALADNLADVIGILKTDDITTLANNATLKCTYCIKGDIDAGLLVLPDTVTLNTAVGNKQLRDVLTGLGFVLKTVTELSNFDN